MRIIGCALLVMMTTGCATSMYVCDYEEKEDYIEENCSGEITKFHDQGWLGYRDSEWNELEDEKETTFWGEIRSYTRHGGSSRERFCETRNGVRTGVCYERR